MAMSEEKARKTNLINRRTVAYLLELTVVSTACSPITALFGAYANWGALIAYLLCRDLIGAQSVGKRLVGLGIATPDGDSGSIGAKLIRNIPLCIPLFPIVEFFVAYYGDEHMQRLGDKFANTRVIDLQPDTKGKGTWSAQLVVSVVILMAAQNLVIPAIVSALS